MTRFEMTERLGKSMARKLFEAKGNHSEIHLSEAELGGFLAGGMDLILELTKDALDRSNGPRDEESLS